MAKFLFLIICLIRKKRNTILKGRFIRVLHKDPLYFILYISVIILLKVFARSVFNFSICSSSFPMLLLFPLGYNNTLLPFLLLLIYVLLYCHNNTTKYYSFLLLFSAQQCLLHIICWWSSWGYFLLQNYDKANGRAVASH